MSTKTKVYEGTVLNQEGSSLYEGEFRISLSEKTKSYFLKFGKFAKRGIAVSKFISKDDSMTVVFTEKGSKFSSLKEVKITNYSFVAYETIEKKATPKKVVAKKSYAGEVARIEEILSSMKGSSLKKSSKEEILSLLAKIK